MIKSPCSTLAIHDKQWGDMSEPRTLLDAILLGLALALLLVDSLNALVEVVLGGGALGRVLALCKKTLRVSK